MSVPVALVKRLVPVGLAAAALGLASLTALAQPAMPPAQSVATAPVAAAPAAPVTGGGSARTIITARDFAFDFPDQIPAGVNSFRLVNQGQEPHHAQFVRVKDGVAPEQFFAAAQQSPGAALALVTTEGGPSIVGPGEQQDVTLDLPAGFYVLLCFVESPDGTPHLAKGMVKVFTVTPPPTGAPAPASDGRIVLRDFSFTIPTIRAGTRTLEIANEGPQPHEIALTKLAPGRTIEEALASENPEAEGIMQPVGGFQAIDAGKRGWMTADFTPGTYVAVCFVPDPQSGKPHVELGMIQPFQVQ